MTNEELIERLKALAVDLPLAFNKGSLLDVDDVAVALNDAAVALEAATVEPEWEYGVLYPWHEGVLDHSVGFDSKAEALKRLDASQDVLVRRRKAGAWEPVGGDDA